LGLAKSFITQELLHQSNKGHKEDFGFQATFFDPKFTFPLVIVQRTLQRMRKRLDLALVERGLCETREKAKRAILAGQVRVNQQRARKPSDPVHPDDELQVLESERYVSRGGYKL
jgi:ribosomal protein S4